MPGNASENPVAEGGIRSRNNQAHRGVGHEPLVAKVAKAPLMKCFSTTSSEFNSQNHSLHADYSWLNIVQDISTKCLGPWTHHGDGIQKRTVDQLGDLVL